MRCIGLPSWRRLELSEVTGAGAGPLVGCLQGCLQSCGTPTPGLPLQLLPDAGLGGWITYQRRLWKAGKLPLDHYHALAALGFEFDHFAARSAWCRTPGTRSYSS